MALLKFAKLTANGTAISGHCSVEEMAGVDVSSDTIECFEASWGTSRYSEDGSSYSSAHRRQLPLRLVTRLDESLPALQQACTENQTVDGVVYLFDTNPEDGATRNYFNVTISGARVVSVTANEHDALSKAGTRVATVTIELLANKTLYEDLVGSTEYEDDWNTTP